MQTEASGIRDAHQQDEAHIEAPCNSDAASGDRTPVGVLGTHTRQVPGPIIEDSQSRYQAVCGDALPCGCRFSLEASAVHAGPSLLMPGATVSVPVSGGPINPDRQWKRASSNDTSPRLAMSIIRCLVGRQMSPLASVRVENAIVFLKTIAFMWPGGPSSVSVSTRAPCRGRVPERRAAPCDWLSWCCPIRRTVLSPVDTCVPEWYPQRRTYIPFVVAQYRCRVVTRRTEVCQEGRARRPHSREGVPRSLRTGPSIASPRAIVGLNAACARQICS